MSKFKVGDRVLVKHHLSDRWTCTKTTLRVRKRVPATVKMIYKSGLLVAFDLIRKSDNGHRAHLYPGDLEEINGVALIAEDTNP